MIRLKATTPEEIKQEFIDRKRDIAVEIVTTILHAIENSLDEVLVDIECPIEMDISVQKEDYDKALKTNSITLLEYEEYELLQKVKQLGIELDEAELVRTNSTGLTIYNPENLANLIKGMKNKTQTREQKIALRKQYESVN